MTEIAEVSEVIKQYAKHGWVLRRVLLSDASLRDNSFDQASLFGGVPVLPDEFDGLWFSRASNPGSEAWELRRLGSSPYALLTVISDSASEAMRDEALDALARKIRTTLTRGN